jgi:hypothetical protein
LLAKLADYSYRVVQRGKLTAGWRLPADALALLAPQDGA